MTDEQYDYYLRLGYSENYLNMQRNIESVSRSLRQVGASFAEVGRATGLFVTAWKSTEGNNDES